MRRGSNDMQVNVAGFRRNLKNFAHNYSDAQKKVREATSNDPWGPSSTIMAEIADLTYNVVAFSEIMQMVWKRLNDHGRNWRHVYKALVLLEYLIKTGSEKVGQQCKENIFAIQTLKDFQHLEEGKDQGQNVREKAKQLVNLLKDDERLKNERARALKAKERFAQSASGFGSDGGLDTPCSPKYPAFRGEWSSNREPDLPREIEVARPQTAGEEELQLQLALAMSREEAEQEEQKRKSDDVRLQLALSQSQHDFKSPEDKVKPSHMVDLLDVSLNETSPVDPWGMPQAATTLSSPWQAHVLPSGANATLTSRDPWRTAETTTSPDNTNHTSPLAKPDPWAPISHSSSPDFDEFDVITNRNHASPQLSTTNGTINANDPFELNMLSLSASTGAMKKTPQSFLGENSALVNLDNLVTSKPLNSTITANPFSESQTQQKPIFNAPAPRLTINEMKQAAIAPFATSTTTSYNNAGVGMSVGIKNQMGTTSQAFGSNGNYVGSAQSVHDPWAPVSSNSQLGDSWSKAGTEPANPFLS